MNPRAARTVLTLLLALPFAGCGSNNSVTGLAFSETGADSFAVAAAGTLSVQAFAGNIDVRPGSAGMVRVTATKRARSRADLREIVLDMSTSGSRVRIVTDNPNHVQNVSVDLEIIAPADVVPVISEGAGGVRYEGRPAGPWWFSIGAGALECVLPADVGTMVDLAVGAGSIASDFTITGTTTAFTAVGTIGSGVQGSITAQLGTGTIRLTRQ